MCPQHSLMQLRLLRLLTCPFIAAYVPTTFTYTVAPACLSLICSSVCAHNLRLCICTCCTLFTASAQVFRPAQVIRLKPPHRWSDANLRTGDQTQTSAQVISLKPPHRWSDANLNCCMTTALHHEEFTQPTNMTKMPRTSSYWHYTYCSQLWKILPFLMLCDHGCAPNLPGTTASR